MVECKCLCYLMMYGKIDGQGMRSKPTTVEVVCGRKKDGLRRKSPSFRHGLQVNHAAK